MCTGALSAVLDNYETLLTLDEVHTTGWDEYAIIARGYVRQFQHISTYFGLKLCMVIFAPIEQQSCTLQSKDITVPEEELYLSQRYSCEGNEQVVPLKISTELLLLHRISLRSLSCQASLLN